MAAMREYTIVIEDAGSNLSAFVLDFDGYTTTGRTVEEIMTNMREAISTHLELMSEAGEEIPEPLDLVGTTKIAF
jgi:predicted RNase H-like HicB family nuclease